MLSPITEKIPPGTKSSIPSWGCGHHSSATHHSFCRWAAQPMKTNGVVLAGSLAWSGSFQCEFDNYGQGVRALTGINSFESAISLPAGKSFATPTMLWVWSTNGLGEHEPEIPPLGARLRHARRPYAPAGVGSIIGRRPVSTLTSSASSACTIPPRKSARNCSCSTTAGLATNIHVWMTTAGLGDWQPNRQRLPNGLAPLGHGIGETRAALWDLDSNRKMVNPKSETVRRASRLGHPPAKTGNWNCNAISSCSTSPGRRSRRTSGM